ncbi:MAG: DUF721 domain-containing protein [Lentisphaeria bacterium]|nr:DUF721 domain-containing protein [Lentisphaeria bacterium]NQZ66744.1 DUF721 domain-containing protein [Lentisphaeria bacterium]
MKEDEKKDSGWMAPKDHHKKSHGYRVRSSEENARERLMKSWYGDNGYLEIEAKQSKEKSVNEVLDTLFQKWNMDDKVTLRKLVSEWDKVVGIEFSKYASPRSLENKLLNVEIFNSLIRFKLEPLKADILERVKAIAGDEVQDIRFIAGGISSNAAK